MPLILPCCGCFASTGGPLGLMQEPADRVRDIVAQVEAAPDEPVIVFCPTCQILIGALSLAGFGDDDLGLLREARRRAGALIPEAKLITDATAIARFVELYREVLAEARG
jgi:hypothetical protein